MVSQLLFLFAEFIFLTPKKLGIIWITYYSHGYHPGFALENWNFPLPGGQDDSKTMLSSPPMEDRGLIFQSHWGVSLFIWTVGWLLHMGGLTIRISPWGLQYQFLAQLANTGPKSVKVNLTNYHREVCWIKFYQLVTYDVLTSLWKFDKMLFW